MEKYKLEKVRAVQTMLESLADKVEKLTSGNLSHNMASIRSVTTNINEVMIDDLINLCDENDKDLKELLEKIERNICGIDNVLQTITPSTVDNGKKHVSTWIKFYADALQEILLKYEI